MALTDKEKQLIVDKAFVDGIREELSKDRELADILEPLKRMRQGRAWRAWSNWSNK